MGIAGTSRVTAGFLDGVLASRRRETGRIMIGSRGRTKWRGGPNGRKSRTML